MGNEVRKYKIKTDLEVDIEKVLEIEKPYELTNYVEKTAFERYMREDPEEAKLFVTLTLKYLANKRKVYKFIKQEITSNPSTDSCVWRAKVLDPSKKHIKFDEIKMNNKLKSM